MEQETRKLVKGVLEINIASLAVGLTVNFFTNPVFGLLAFGISLLPMAVIFQRLKE